MDPGTPVKQRPTAAAFKPQAAAVEFPIDPSDDDEMLEAVSLDDTISDAWAGVEAPEGGRAGGAAADEVTPKGVDHCGGAGHRARREVTGPVGEPARAKPDAGVAPAGGRFLWRGSQSGCAAVQDGARPAVDGGWVGA